MLQVHFKFINTGDELANLSDDSSDDSNVEQKLGMHYTEAKKLEKGLLKIRDEKDMGVKFSGAIKGILRLDFMSKYSHLTADRSKPPIRRNSEGMGSVKKLTKSLSFA